MHNVDRDCPLPVFGPPRHRWKAGPDLKLSWLEAFVVLARTGDQRLAARRLHIGRTSFDRRFDALQNWLHLPLFDIELRRLTSLGEGFLETAEDVLESIGAATRSDARRSHRPAIGSLSFSELRTLQAARGARTYADIAHRADCSHDQVRRDIKRLEAFFGVPLLSGRSTIGLTKLGHEIWTTVDAAVGSLQLAIPWIPDDFDPIGHELKRSARIIRTQAIPPRARLGLVMERAQRRPTKDNRRTSLLAKPHYHFLGRVIRDLNEFLPPSPLLPSKGGEDG